MNPKNKNSKTRYFHYQREIINIISEPATYIDKKNTFIFVNSAFNKFYNLETKDVIGKTPHSIWNDSEFGKQIRNSLQKCMRGTNISVQFEGTIADNNFKIIEMNYYPHYNKEGKVDGVISITKDVTEHKLTERRLKENEARLKELNAIKNKLFSIIGHDLLNPLSNITGFSELIENGYDLHDNQEIRYYNRIIYQLSKSVTELLENILNWAGSQNKQIRLMPHDISLQLIIEKCHNLLIHNLRLKDINLVNLIPTNAKVFADEELLTVVIRNLISNAIKFTHRGGKITLTWDVDNEDAIIGIRDTGIGIPTEKLEKIFHARNSFSLTGTEGETGTGLGLILSKEFVEKNNGRIWIESTPGKGSIVYFTVPVAIKTNKNVSYKEN